MTFVVCVLVCVEAEWAMRNRGERDGRVCVHVGSTVARRHR
jgi:hypothetical protein